MKIYSKRLKKTGLRAKFIFSNALPLLLLVCCTKESINKKNLNFPVPHDLIFESSISLETKHFSPEKIVCDIKGNLFILADRRRIILVKETEELEEMNMEEIYPCEIVDISSDGFDIFLLDKMNRKIWTLKREKILEKGFTLEARPLFFSVSEKGLFTVIYSNSREFSCFSRTEKMGRGFLLEEGIMEGDGGALQFQKNSIYFANKKRNRVVLFNLYNPSKKSFIDVESPTSLALDSWENLFVATLNGITCITKNGTKKKLLSNEQFGAKISISKERLYILNPEEKRIDVFKIFYTSSEPDISGRE
ncbi:MAG: hypothetical protein E3J87_07580 [Candidatus Cloacimonadota bacterium]|nr:MAG: hypothetical protein E3J87_07580 [Candidatus Cloacimonadota bacterium]